MGDGNCDHCQGEPGGCGKLLRNAYWAMVQGRECRGGTREADGHVLMTGPATQVFTGDFPLEPSH